MCVCTYYYFIEAFIQIEEAHMTLIKKAWYVSNQEGVPPIFERNNHSERTSAGGTTSVKGNYQLIRQAA